jgi:hypothetical protein
MPHSYDAMFTWPFSTLPVVVYQIEGQAATVSLDALLDTGADVTLVPVEYLQAILLLFPHLLDGWCLVCYTSDVRWGDLPAGFIKRVCEEAF